MSVPFFNKSHTKIEVDSNQLHNSVAYTELAFYTWGGSDSEDAFDIAIDSSNNSYVIGWTNSFGAGERDLCLIKFNSSGVEWNRTFGGNYSDWGRSIELDSFDNIYITGYTGSYGTGGYDIWLLKINSTGGAEWNYTWGGIYDDVGWDLALDSLNNAYVTGYTNSFGEGDLDMCLVKFNSSGVVWNYTCGGSNRNLGHAVTLDLLGNAYVVGDTKSFGAGKDDIYLVKFNSSGMIWNYTWGCVMDDHGTEVILAPSGDLYVAGYYEKPPNCYISPGFGINSDIGLLKFTSEGIYEWNSTWEEGYLDYSSGMVIDSLGNIYIAGYTLTDGYGDYDWCLVRFNSSAIADWYCLWGTSESEACRGLTLGPNRTAFATGYTIGYGAGGSDICLVQFLLDKCPVPEISDDKVITGYEAIILLAIALALSTFLIKRKQLFSSPNQ
ncbi:MAG: SBBP repeat-containing protein [Candidatus Thorarchaeota archaeon]